MTGIRVLIADDQMLVRQGFTVLLGAEPGIEVVGPAIIKHRNRNNDQPAWAA